VSVLAALADPVRREIVELLAAGEMGAGEIAARFPVSRPAISRHLRVLREAGLVTDEVRAQRRVYRLERAPLALLDGWLDRFRPLPGRDATPHGEVGRALPGLAGRLDALDTELRRGRRRRNSGGEVDDDRTGDRTDDRTAG
jgi:DNA-binding transcriptional ArsR family regulator